MVENVLRSAFSCGFGQTLAEVRASDTYLSTAAAQRRNLRRFHPARSLEGLLLRRDPLLSGLYLNSRSIRRAQMLLRRARKESFDADERTLVHTFGKELLTAAGKPLRQETAPLVREWQCGSAAERIAIARQVVLRFGPTFDPGDILIDVLLQGPSGVLPAHFGEREHHPNCLGSVQQALAYFSLLGARTYAVSVLTRLRAVTEASQAHIAKLILERYGEPESKCDKELVEDLEVLLEEQETAEQLGGFQHFACIVEIDADTWAFVDPSQSQFALLSKRDADVRRTLSLLDRFAGVLPGLMVLHHTSGMADQLMKEVGEPALEIAGYIPELQRIFRSSEPDPYQRIIFGVPEDVAHRVLKYTEFPYANAFGDLETTEKSRQMLGFTIQANHFAMQYDDLVDGIEPDPLVCGDSSGDAMWREMAALYPRTFAQGAMDFISKRTDELAPELCHPLVEVGDSAFTIGAATLAHLAWCWKFTDETEEHLVRHTNSQFRHAAYVGGLVRQKGEKRDLRRWRALEILSRVPRKLSHLAPLFKALGYHVEERNVRVSEIKSPTCQGEVAA